VRPAACLLALPIAACCLTASGEGASSAGTGANGTTGTGGRAGSGGTAGASTSSGAGAGAGSTSPGSSAGGASSTGAASTTGGGTSAGGSSGGLSTCTLVAVPNPLSFGNVTVGPTTRTVALTDVGGGDCHVTGISFAATTDPAFSLQSPFVQAVVGPGQSANVGVTFDVPSWTPPQLRQGTLDVASDDPTNPLLAIPMSAYLEPECFYGGAWTQWQGDSSIDGVSYSDTSGLTGTIVWSAVLGPPDAGSGYQSAPVEDGCESMIYANDPSGTVHAFDYTGEPLWVLSLGALPTSPAALADSTLAELLGASPGGALSISSQGARLSTQAAGMIFLSNANAGFTALRAAAEIDGGVVAFTPDGGTFPLQIPLGPVSVAVGNDGTSYWAGGGTLEALTPPPFAPKPGWAAVTLGTGATAETSGLALDVDNTGLLFMQVAWLAGGAQSIVYAFDAQSGAGAWSETLLLEPADGGATPLPPYGSIAVGPSGTVYAGFVDGLHALAAATGQPRWTFPSPAVTTPPTIGGDGTIFFGAADGKLYAVTPAGTLRFVVTTGGPITSPASITGDGTLLFTSADGNLYAVR